MCEKAREVNFMLVLKGLLGGSFKIPSTPKFLQNKKNPARN